MVLDAVSYYVTLLAMSSYDFLSNLRLIHVNLVLHTKTYMYLLNRESFLRKIQNCGDAFSKSLVYV